MMFDDVLITGAEKAVLVGERRRIVGRNARLPVHGNSARDPVVRIETSAGVSGWGWSAAREEEARALVGKRLGEVFTLDAGVLPSARAFDFPLWDLAARAIRRPVYDLLGDAGQNPVPAYDGSIYLDDLDPETGEDRGIAPVLDAVREGMELGFRAFKVKIGRGFRWMAPDAGFRRDVEVLFRIRELVGPHVGLLMDANNGYTPDGARALMREVGGLGVHWFEEPFPEGMEECRAFHEFLAEGGYDTLLADGEGSERDDEAFHGLVEAGAMDVVQFDMRGYSLTRWRDYLPRAVRAGAVAAPHNWGSHLSGFYIAHLGRGCGGVSMAEIDTMAMPAVSSDAYAWRDGGLWVPDAPGFGLELDDGAFQEAQAGTGGWSVSAP
jgi:L-alanine-DL-glutamate epimerase-like enolase superfamily enzyme